jgi:hypothetical protein
MGYTLHMKELKLLEKDLELLWRHYWPSTQ